MRFKSVRFLAALLGVILFGAGPSPASTSPNQVGAVLVFPLVVALPGQETYVTITNASTEDIIVHVSFIDGFEGTAQSPNPDYCKECDFSMPMTAGDTDQLLFLTDCAGGVNIVNQDTSVARSCSGFIGMVVVSLEDESGNTLSKNILLGDSVYVDFDNGYATSTPALPFQGLVFNDGDRAFEFDDREFSAFPSVVATDFIAPDSGAIGPVTAELVLFTLGFEHHRPPSTSCSVNGFDAHENQFSGSLQFGCWTLIGLQDIGSEYIYGFLGEGNQDSHGWLSLSCDVDVDNNGSFDAQGGVHGSITQKLLWPGVNREPFGFVPQADAAFSRLLYQSGTVGGDVTLELAESPNFGE